MTEDIVCIHNKTHNESWPDGGGIEVCDECGMSRYHWEQGESNWLKVDIERSRRELKEYLEYTEKEKVNG